MTPGNIPATVKTIATPPKHTPEVGSTEWFSEWQVRFVTEGGACDLYKGVDPVLRRPVAIKVLKPYFVERGGTLYEEGGLQDRASRELAAMNAEQPYCILPVYSAAIWNHDRFPSTYIMMPFASGRSWNYRKEELLCCRSRTPNLWLTELGSAVEGGWQLSIALCALEKGGIAHRDIKPKNVLTHCNSAALIDFGTAALLTEEEVPAHLRSLPSFTPQFAAPEQINYSWFIDSRSDIYSFGATLYNVLSGVLPVQGTTLHDYQCKAAKGDWDIVPLMDRFPNQSKLVLRATTSKIAGAEAFAVMKEMERIIMRCLKFEPDDRYQKAEDLFFDLSKVLGKVGEPI